MLYPRSPLITTKYPCLLHSPVVRTSVCPKEHSPDPRRGTPHLFADRIKAHAHAALYDDLIIHMGHYPAIPQGLHGMACSEGVDVRMWLHFKQILHTFRSGCFPYAELRFIYTECLCKAYFRLDKAAFALKCGFIFSESYLNFLMHRFLSD